MKNKLLIAILLIMSVVSSCKKFYLKEIENSKIELGEIVNHVISMEQAKKVAVLHTIYPEPLKRVAKNKTSGNTTSSSPSEVQMQRLEKTIKSTFGIKDKENKPLLYIVNYNEGGFAIVAGDDRMLPILAYGDKNNFREPDTSKIDNPGLKFWLRENLNYISDLKSGKVKEQKLATSAWKDFERKSQLTLNNKSVSIEWPPCEDEGDLDQTFISENWEVYFPTALFDQGTPFNDFLPAHSNCATPKIGCVAVATSIIMKYWEYPSSAYNWSAINNSGTVTNETKYLLRDAYNYLGRDLGIWRSVSCSATGAPYFLSTWALNDWGYSNDTFDPINVSVVKNDIVAGRPVILSGGTHQWVANGVRQFTVFMCQENPEQEDPPIESRNPPVATQGWVEVLSYTFLYMNWGWGGYDNDWYSSYAWNPVNSGTNYSSNMRALTGIHP